VADPEHPALEALRSRLAQEEAAYAEVLAAIDRLSAFSLPAEAAPEVRERLAELNTLWPTAPPPAPGGIAGGIRRLAWNALAPALERQQAWNAALVQLLNAYLAQADAIHARLRELAGALVRYAQRVEPVVDARDLSPLPPLPSGVADYAADLLPLVAARHEIELFHAQDGVDTGRLPGGLALHPATAFVDRHRRHPYDLAVYQLGNGRSHDFLYDLVTRVPGLLVLHDLVLHHARAAHFLEAEPVRAWRASPGSVAARERAEPVLAAWRAELEYAYPGRGERLFAAQLGTVGDLLPYAYPLFRIPVEASRLVAVHNRFMAEAIRQEVKQARVECAPMPVSRLPVESHSVRRLRARLGFDDRHLVVGVFGLLTPEKRPLSVARAVARLAGVHDGLRLLLVGEVPDQPRLEAQLHELGVRARSVLTGRVPLSELATHIEAADVVAHLRYPTARETSAALLRVLAQGRPTIVSDLEQQAELPQDVVLRVDLSDEDAALATALERLLGDAGLRRALAQAASDHVRREHAPERVAAAWEAVFERARQSPAPLPRDWPAHWPRPGA